MPTIEPYAARGVWDPPMYSQAVKVSGAQTILYIAGQVAYGPDGNPVHAGDFKAQARAALQALKAQVEAPITARSARNSSARRCRLIPSSRSRRSPPRNS